MPGLRNPRREEMAHPTAIVTARPLTDGQGLPAILVGVQGCWRSARRVGLSYLGVDEPQVRARWRFAQAARTKGAMICQAQMPMTWTRPASPAKSSALRV